MTLLVETGSASSTSEAYATVSEADAYVAKYISSDTTWASASESTKEAALREGALYIDNHWRGRWKGIRVSRVQALEHPRFGLTDADNYAWPSDTVHPNVAKASIEAAARQVAGTVLEPDEAATDRGVKSKAEKFAVFSSNVEYMGGSTLQPGFTRITALLRGLTQGGSIEVERG